MQGTTLISEEKNWQQKALRRSDGKETFSADDVIDAYLKGAKDQADRDRSLRMEKFESNLTRAKQLAENFYAEILKDGFKCKEVKLKIKDIYSFTALFLIDENDFCDDSFSEIYKKSIALKKKENTDSTFDFTIIFTPVNPALQEKNLHSDGYILTYAVQES